MDFGVREHFFQQRHHGGRHGRSRAENAPNARERFAARVAVFGDFSPKNRRAERVGDAVFANCANDFFRIERGGFRGVHFGRDGRHAQRGIEKRENRQQRQIDFARRDPVKIAHDFALRVEHAVRVANAFRRARGAAREKNCGEEVGIGVRDFRRQRFIAGTFFDFAGKFLRADGDGGFHRSEFSEKHAARPQRGGNADERRRLRFADAFQKTF